ncbi:MAG: NAD(P)H-binding protein [Actinobacteria bacterium]|nr:NAD(P)H-binding protein [Actinomycetota bacterium]
MNISIIGGTGTIGSHVVRTLAERGHAPLALARSEAAAQAVRDLGGVPHTGSLDDPETIRHLVAEAHAVLLLTGNGPDQVRHECGAIDAVAATSKATIVKVSVPGAAADSPFEIGKVHHTIEEHLRASGLDHSVVRPGWLMQNIALVTGGIRDRDELALPIGEGAVAAIDARDVALVCALLLEDPTGAAGTDHMLIGAADITGTSMAAALSSGAGRPIAFRDSTLDEFSATLLASGVPEAAVGDLGMLYDVIIRHGFLAGASNAAPDLTAQPARTFEDFATAHRDWFTRS